MVGVYEMCELISKQTAKPRYIDANEIPYCEVLDADTHKGTGRFMADKKDIDALPSVQTDGTDTNVGTTISRQAAIDEIEYELEMINSALDSITLDFNARERLRQRRGEAREILNSIQQLPSVQPDLSQEYAKAVFAWLLDYQIKAAELKGRYTPYEVLSWVANDWRKENRWIK